MKKIILFSFLFIIFYSCAEQEGTISSQTDYDYISKSNNSFLTEIYNRPGRVQVSILCKDCLQFVYESHVSYALNIKDMERHSNVLPDFVEAMKIFYGTHKTGEKVLFESSKYIIQGELK